MATTNARASSGAACADCRNVIGTNFAHLIIKLIICREKSDSRYLRANYFEIIKLMKHSGAEALSGAHTQETYSGWKRAAFTHSLACPA